MITDVFISLNNVESPANLQHSSQLSQPKQHEPNIDTVTKIQKVKTDHPSFKLKLDLKRLETEELELEQDDFNRLQGKKTLG